MPQAEVLVWSVIKNKQVRGIKFRRQYSIDRFVVDFYAPALKLAIELDGESHYGDGGREKDAERDAILAGLGIRVIRILNTDVYGNLEGVYDFVGGAIEKMQAQ